MSAAGKGGPPSEPASQLPARQAKKSGPRTEPADTKPAKAKPATVGPTEAGPTEAGATKAGSTRSKAAAKSKAASARAGRAPAGQLGVAAQLQARSEPAKPAKPASKPRKAPRSKPGPQATSLPPEPADPELAEIDLADAVVGGGAITDPELVDPELVDPELAEPELADQDIFVSGLADPELGASEASLVPPEPALVPPVAAPQRESRWSTRDRERERVLLGLLAELPADDPQRAAARDELVRMHMPLAAFLARRFRDRGEHLDDLTQVATVGLIKAVDRFETGRGVEFSTFATPTIVGEIKRHFRDKGWAIRVPRRLQELRLAITRATAELSQSQGTSPTVGQLAARLGLSEEEVLEGLESAAAYATLSLDSAGSGDSAEEGASIAETVGDLDPNLAEVDTRETLHPLLASLGEREQRIVYMRFYENKTQAQIAQEIGVSQMHISRLLAKSLAQMRSGLAVEP